VRWHTEETHACNDAKKSEDFFHIIDNLLSIINLGAKVVIFFESTKCAWQILRI
jgi:hypothetical protein